MHLFGAYGMRHDMIIIYSIVGSKEKKRLHAASIESRCSILGLQ